MKIFFILSVFLTASFATTATTLVVRDKLFSKAIQSAKPGDTLIIKPGYYKPRNVIINKPLTIIGEGMPTIDGENKYELFTITAKRVTIQGIRFINTGKSTTLDFAAIKAYDADGLCVLNNRIIDAYFGIHISNTSHATIVKNYISRTSTENSETSIGNAIHLWKSDHALIEQNRVSNHRDGIYFEFVTNSIIKKNHSEKNLRYGLHFMFSNQDQYIDNEFVNNGAGVAVMYTHSVTMTGNLFANNWGASAYGLLLKDIRDSEVNHNRFINNTMGIYMEGSSRINFRNNEFNGNGYALRIQASCDQNVFEKNNLKANTFDIATNGSMVLNTFEKNYWDKYEGYDLNKDGFGDTFYRPVNLYSMIVERIPVSILLWRSFMVFLLDRAEKNFPAITPENLLDNKPSMKPYDFVSSRK
ncbi:MAG: nitrous oxide reductase family maturation protein NosD [Bacteroidetes bacterium]|nr:nitrous oxide reductase family maturation protein NosD [Bacteroidota bacterium]